ncbi:hypothetical protein GKZ68_16155 [Hymenobacter sp. BRD128]|uniref:hypothetical protein n=1 Tax=Hymenobacter sp. BRD128 TaxID=2675878 RepID=UPI0015664641|nr:hypothetical protein [Hymenobacter sp. BRD128]QKG58016.1 hypothetical protein GKZ68_16155 [Hymenobacter sp. BRD128]
MPGCRPPDLCGMARLVRTPEIQHRIHVQDRDILGHFSNAREDQVTERYAPNTASPV